MAGVITAFPGMRGGEARVNKRLSPIDCKLRQLRDEAGRPRTRKWLAGKVGVSYTCICHWCNGGLPDSLNNVYLRRAMQVLNIDENYLLGLPRSG